MTLRTPPDGLGPAPFAHVALAPGSALAWGAAVGLAMSTQLLFQPFVWRHYAWDEVLDGWLVFAGQRLAVTLSIALALALASRVPAPPLARRPLLWRAATMAAAIVLGALAGEIGLLFADPRALAPTPLAVAMRVAQWCLLAASITSLWYLWRRHSVDSAAAQAAELRRIATERQVVQARLQTLRSQIEPHFLFNTLATVRRLHHVEREQGARLLAHFLDYLRSALRERPDARHKLGHEVELVRAYLAVVAVRMAGRLRYEVDVDDALGALDFPALTVATLVENAIKHGIAPAPLGGCITVRARRDGTCLEVSVVDTGVGFDAAAVGGHGIGLANIRWRLAALYNERASLVLEANVPHGVRAAMRVPLAF